MSNKKKLKEQSFVFDRKIFNNKRQIKNWMKNNDRKLPKNKKDPIRIYAKSYRVRIKEPNRFNKRSFCSETLGKGVVVVKARLK